VQPAQILHRLKGSFRVPVRVHSSRERKARRIAEDLLFSGLRGLMQSARRMEGGNVFDRLLRALEIELAVPPGDWERIPESGPLVVAANHPTGLLDGAIAASLCLRRRQDVRILVNHLLPSHEEIDPYLIRVDPYGRAGSVSNNRGAMREAVRWLKKGGALIVFPAGDVSRIDWKHWSVEDPEWNPSVARLIRAGGAAALPLHIRAGNSPVFHLLGAVHPRLKTVRLPFEMLNKRGASVSVRAGMPVPLRKLAQLDDAALMAHLRARSILLGKCSSTALPQPPPAGERAAAAAVTPSLLERSLRRRCLVETPEWAVTAFQASEDPELMREIGRLRERTFRAAGEGTGREIDVDRFDGHYDQLVLWNLRDGAIAGGYRIGATQAILPVHGPTGLYTSTLFRFQPEFFRRLGPAAELGRSFVCPEYQKLYMPLLMLWQGIGAWIVRHPDCRYLFGPVSISDTYAPASRLLLSTALLETAGEPALARLVRPRRPLRSPEAGAVRREWRRLRLSEPDQLSELVASLEPDGKGMPVLLRQYLKLGGRLLAFNVDRHFSNTLDGLILVDLLRTEPQLLQRYLTAEGAKTFLSYWQEQERAKAAS
jgi:putative hemolysin